ncbi:MAG TPA: iron-containing alcohol dehydrogenase, partial [Candidatus Bathyarchaeia archaeon]|nr:iron-containing alcohol dehydrogenase [Candidatus Bathyarchaeia archaeon]
MTGGRSKKLLSEKCGWSKSMRINSFHTPREIVYGWGALEHLRKMRARRAAVFTDRQPMEKYGFLKRAREYMEENGAVIGISPDISSEPTSEDISKGLKWAQEFNPDFIVALGGGSVIDVSKTIRSMLDRPTFDFGELTRLFDFPRNEEKVRPLVAVPTTSGTGSEVTPYVVFVDPHLRLKRVLVSEELMPDTAIVDPEVSSTMPPSITANTGFDALSHGLESYVCTTSNDFSEPLALKAIQLVFENLERSYKDGTDRNAREKVHYASTLAGIAIANSAGGLA